MSTLKTAVELAMEDAKAHQHPIPPMTDPLGKHWRQPNRLDIEITATHALMSKAAFDQIADYTNSQPTGVYPGKMWKKGNRNNDQERGRWWLHWWTAHPTNEKLCCHNVREILIHE